MSVRMYYHIDFSQASQADRDRFAQQMASHVYADSAFAHLRPRLNSSADGSQAVLRVHWPETGDVPPKAKTAADAMKAALEKKAYVTVLASAEDAAAIVAEWAA